MIYYYLLNEAYLIIKIYKIGALVKTSNNKNNNDENQLNKNNFVT
jgi:hypothetical protein